MAFSTAMPLNRDPMPESAVSGVSDERFAGPVAKTDSTTRTTSDTAVDTSPTSNDRDLSRKLEPPVPTKLTHLTPDSIPIQIWEGTVVDVDYKNRIMIVTLDAKIGQIARHTGDIDLEWVSEQDEDLVRPGAVFYLILFKRTIRGSIQNAQELRFRRRPSWSAGQISQLQADAQIFLSKMKDAPIAQ